MRGPKDDKQALVMMGAGGHAKVLLALVRACGYPIAGVCDPRLVAERRDRWEGVRVLGDDGAVDSFDPSLYGLINGIGKMPKQDQRERLYQYCFDKGFSFPVLVHPSAWVAEDTQLDDGVQIMAGVVVQPGCTVSRNSIINTKASIDHDCCIGAHVHVAPGATLSGNVNVHDNTFIGAGATVLQGRVIGSGAIVAAGAVCTSDLAPRETFVGDGHFRR